MNNSLRKSREVSDNAKGYLLVSGCIVDVWQSMRLLTAGSLVRAQLEEPNKDNSFDTKTVVLFLCLKRLNRAVCWLCACQGYACNLTFLNGELPIISIFTVFSVPLTRKQGK